MTTEAGSPPPTSSTSSPPASPSSAPVQSPTPIEPKPVGLPGGVQLNGVNSNSGSPPPLPLPSSMTGHSQTIPCMTAMALSAGGTLLTLKTGPPMTTTAGTPPQSYVSASAVAAGVLSPCMQDSSKKSKSGPGMKRRSRRAARDIVRSHKCKMGNCTKAYGSEGALKTHIKLKHSTGHNNSHHDGRNGHTIAPGALGKSYLGAGTGGMYYPMTSPYMGRPYPQPILPAGTPPLSTAAVAGAAAAAAAAGVVGVVGGGPLAGTPPSAPGPGVISAAAAAAAAVAAGTAASTGGIPPAAPLSGYQMPPVPLNAAATSAMLPNTGGTTNMQAATASTSASSSTLIPTVSSPSMTPCSSPEASSSPLSSSSPSSFSPSSSASPHSSVPGTGTMTLNPPTKGKNSRNNNHNHHCCNQQPSAAIYSQVLEMPASSASSSSFRSSPSSSCCGNDATAGESMPHQSPSSENAAIKVEGTPARGGPATGKRKSPASNSTSSRNRSRNKAAKTSNPPGEGLLSVSINKGSGRKPAAPKKSTKKKDNSYDDQINMFNFNINTINSSSLNLSLNTTGVIAAATNSPLMQMDKDPTLLSLPSATEANFFTSTATASSLASSANSALQAAQQQQLLHQHLQQNQNAANASNAAVAAAAAAAAANGFLSDFADLFVHGVMKMDNTTTTFNFLNTAASSCYDDSNMIQNYCTCSDENCFACNNVSNDCAPQMPSNAFCGEMPTLAPGSPSSYFASTSAYDSSMQVDPTMADFFNSAFAGSCAANASEFSLAPEYGDYDPSVPPPLSSEDEELALPEFVFPLHVAEMLTTGNDSVSEYLDIPN